MKAKTLQILWHNKEPVLSLDFHQPSGLLATAGADKEIRFWSIQRKGHPLKATKESSHCSTPAQQDPVQAGAETISAEYLFSLCHHNYAINALRFSPTGELLASGADGGEIALWKWVGSAAETEQSKQETLRSSGSPEGAQNTRAPAVSSRAQQRNWANLVKKLSSNGWKAFRTLSRHERDVLDLAWSPDGGYLLSGSVDNSAIIWDVPRACPEHFLQDHGHYVQGVSWDPLGAFVTTSSGDRSSRVYSVPYGAPPAFKPSVPPLTAKGKSAKAQAVRCVHILHRREVSASEGGSAVEIAETQAQEESQARAKACGAEEQGGAGMPAVKQGKVHMFYDESMPSFFRRGAWSPDGSLLVLPAGMWRSPGGPAAAGPEQPGDATHAPGNTCYVFSRSDLSRPLMHLPGLSKPLVVVRFSPVFYALDDHVPGGMRDNIKLPYALIFAVASTNSISIYSTQRSHPLALLGGLHYAPITDMAWSSDGLLLMVSSQDGYCTAVTFQGGELGTPLRFSEIPAHVQEVIPAAISANMRGEEVRTNHEEKEEKDLSFSKEGEGEGHDPMSIDAQEAKGSPQDLLANGGGPYKSGEAGLRAQMTDEPQPDATKPQKHCSGSEFSCGEHTSLSRSSSKPCELMNATSIVGNKRSRPQELEQVVVA